MDETTPAGSVVVDGGTMESVVCAEGGEDAATLDVVAANVDGGPVVPRFVTATTVVLVDVVGSLVLGAGWVADDVGGWTEPRWRSVLLESVEHADINAITNRNMPDILSPIDSPRCCSSPTIY